MANKLFVGGLSWNTSDAGLREAFERFGEVAEATVVMDRDTGRSRGFGFVTFSDGDAASKAAEQMNGTELDGRTIRVDLAHDKPRTGGPRRGPGMGGGGGGGGARDRGGRW
jgi:RNA recognition motif-containing protein